MNSGRNAKPGVGAGYCTLGARNFGMLAPLMQPPAWLNPVLGCRRGENAGIGGRRLVQADFSQAGGKAAPGGPDVGIQADRKSD